MRSDRDEPGHGVKGDGTLELQREPRRFLPRIAAPPWAQPALRAYAGSAHFSARGQGVATGAEDGAEHRLGPSNGNGNPTGDHDGRGVVADAVPALSLGAIPRPPATPGSLPALTVIVPTRHEAGNVPELGRRLAAVLPDRNVEVLFVDDSDDDTPDVIAQLAERSERTVRSVHRAPEEREGGLSGAVVEGLRHSTAPFACVMDGDLQHPPELIERMLERGERDGLDLVVASRFCECGNADGFGPSRALLSRASRAAVRTLFPRKISPLTDPMSGFFLVRCAALDLTALRPRGFKILVEVVARSRALRIGEVPLCFGRRHSGSSKASLRQGSVYLVQLLSLRFSVRPQRLRVTSLVGSTARVVQEDPAGMTRSM